MPVEVPGSSEGLGRIPQLPAPPVTQEVMHREEECEEDRWGGEEKCPTREEYERHWPKLGWKGNEPEPDGDCREARKWDDGMKARTFHPSHRHADIAGPRAEVGEGECSSTTVHQLATAARALRKACSIQEVLDCEPGAKLDAKARSKRACNCDDGTSPRFQMRPNV